MVCHQLRTYTNAGQPKAVALERGPPRTPLELERKGGTHTAREGVRAGLTRFAHSEAPNCSRRGGYGGKM
eukprot:6924287-Pyramimonas_sp.AAC.1